MNFLSERPIRRFDTHGTAAFVMGDMEVHVPLIFGVSGQKAVSRLQRLIRNYVNNEPWPFLVASLTSGMPRRELEGFFSREIGHSGPVVIAPDMTRKPKVYASEDKAAAEKDQLARAAERTNGLMLILYGIDNPTMEKNYEIFRNQLQRLDSTLTLILEEDSRLRSARGIAEMDADLRRRLQLLGRSLQDAQQRISGLTSNDFQQDPHGDIYRNLMVMQDMQGATTLGDEGVQRMILALGIIPARYALLGVESPPAAEENPPRAAAPAQPEPEPS